jgi:hypothetical protein
VYINHTKFKLGLKFISISLHSSFKDLNTYNTHSKGRIKCTVFGLAFNTFRFDVTCRNCELNEYSEVYKYYMALDRLLCIIMLIEFNTVKFYKLLTLQVVCGHE